METTEAVLIITELAGKRATQTVIQKLCYFLKVKGIINVEFRPHYYGPYSDVVYESLSSFVGLEFIDEELERSSFSQWRKYTYTPSEDGRKILERVRQGAEYNKAKEIIEKCGKISNFDLDILAAAAKVYYILKREGKGIYESQIYEKAKRLGWEIDDKNIKKAVDLLEALALTRQRV